MDIDNEVKKLNIDYKELKSIQVCQATFIRNLKKEMDEIKEEKKFE